MIHPNLFHDYPCRRGRDWLRRIPDYDRKAFSTIGRFYQIESEAAGGERHHVLGGKARAAHAQRDPKGRFLPKEKGDGQATSVGAVRSDPHNRY